MADFRFNPFNHTYDEVTLVEIHQVDQHDDQGGFYGIRLVESILRESPSSLEVRKITSSDFDIDDVPDTIPVADFDDNNDYSGTDYTEVTKSVTLGSTNFKADYANLDEGTDSLDVIAGQYDTGFISLPSADNDEYFIVKYKGLGRINTEDYINDIQYSNTEMNTFLLNNFSRIQRFTADGTFNVPADSFGRIGFYAVGGGGGGGGAFEGSSGSALGTGAGGGSGVQVWGFIDVTAGESLTIDIGAGGAGGNTSGGDGGGGEGTRILRGSTVLMSAPGGGGGDGGPNEAGAAEGGPSGGNSILGTVTNYLTVAGFPGGASREAWSGDGGGPGGGQRRLHDGAGRAGAANSGGGGGGGITRIALSPVTGGAGGSGFVAIFY